MQVVVVYESLTGNTRKVAEAVADGFRRTAPTAEVTCRPAVEAGTCKDADVIVVGAPTHIRGIPGRRSRAMWAAARRRAETQGKPVPTADQHAGLPGVREFLVLLPKARPGQRAAAFDTRLTPHFAGGAARPIARRLRRRGYRLLSDPIGFVVEGGDGPLRPGDLERATAWAERLAYAAGEPRPEVPAPEVPTPGDGRHRAEAR